MKKLIRLLVVVALPVSSFVQPAAAAPIGSSNQGREYLIGSSALDHWSAGIYGGSQSREIKWSNGGTTDLKSNQGYFYLGYDVIRWMTPYAGLGITDSKFGNVAGDGAEMAYTLGVHFNLLDHEVMDPTLLEDRVRVNADISYGGSKADVGREVKWNDFSANVTVGIVNDLDGNKKFGPESIGIYAGPTYSHLDSDEFEARNTFGFLTGLDFFFTKRVSLEISAVVYDQASVYGALHMRF